MALNGVVQQRVMKNPLYSPFTPSAATIERARDRAVLSGPTDTHTSSLSDHAQSKFNVFKLKRAVRTFVCDVSELTLAVDSSTADVANRFDSSASVYAV